MFRKIRLAAALWIIAPLLVAAQSSSHKAPVPMSPERAADSYAIYSILMPGTPFDNLPPDQAKQWAIADTTVNIDDMHPAVPPDGQLQAPPDNTAAFHEALQDFQSRRYERVQLTRRFNVDHDYDLLNAPKVAELRRAKGAVDAGSDVIDQYSAYPGVTFFSQVYFNTRQTAALVYMNNWCANLCAAGQWVYLEKHAGQWERRSGISAQRLADSYAIYSVLMPGEPFKSLPPDQARRWAIAGTTVNIADMNPAIPPDGELQAPPDNVSGFREALRDFQVRRYERIQLTPRLNLDHAYELLDAAEVAELRRAKATVDAGSDLQDKYAVYPGVTFFSEVFFNASQNAALVYMNNWCANLCAAGQWVYLEKHGGQWVRRSGITAKLS